MPPLFDTSLARRIELADRAAALADAIARYGCFAQVERVRDTYIVGCNAGRYGGLCGMGKTWAEAFAMADRQKAQMDAMFDRDPALALPLNDGWTAEAAERARDMKVSEQLARVVRGEA